MAKQYELIDMFYGNMGGIVAVMSGNGWGRKEISFFDYTKREVINLLRNEYDCTVSKDMEKQRLHPPVKTDIRELLIQLDKVNRELANEKGD